MRTPENSKIRRQHQVRPFRIAPGRNSRRRHEGQQRGVAHEKQPAHRSLHFDWCPREEERCQVGDRDRL